MLSRVVGVDGGLPLLDDGQLMNVANVVWCTGFQQTFDWIDLPVFDGDGWPREMRGVVTEAPGLFFCGLSFQYAFSSMVLPGVGRDADFVARQIAARSAGRILPEGVVRVGHRGRPRERAGGLRAA
jgi:putative flavoprotein involved in K+ transport